MLRLIVPPVGPALLLLLLLSACGGRDRDDRGADAGAGPPAIPDPERGPSVDGDIDGDGIPDAEDNCPSVANADQRSACDYPSRPASTGDVETDGLLRLNWNRLLVGLPPAVEDPELSRTCRLHLDYLVQISDELGSPQLGHTEDLSKPYASEEGNQAGIDSVLSLGQADIGAAVDGWINTLYHRLPLLHPGLERVGIAYRDSYACVRYRPGTNMAAVAPHPILWPPPDIVGTARQFGGNESPCPTAPDPLSASSCPPSAAIPSVGLHGMGRVAGVLATFRHLDLGTDLPLYAVYWDGGESPHEQAGYLDGSASLVPMPDSSLERALYEVRITGTLAGAPGTWRWRFRTSRELPDVGCDDLGEHRTLADAYPIETGTIEGRICEFADMYLLTGSGRRTVTLLLDHDEGDLDLVNLDPSGAAIARSDGSADEERLSADSGTFIQVYGFNRGMGPYILTVE